MRRLSQKGFSLIELMVVVAIIGILAAIAVPNFQNFIVKSRQAEAKANLGALYACEAAFFAEWNQYFADFRDIGLMPEGSLTYNFGFSGAGAVNAPLAPYTGITTANNAATIFVTTGNCGAALPRCTLNNMATNGGAVPAATVTAVGAFVAAATSNLDSDAVLDQWQINQNKTLSLVNPATTNDLL